MRHLTIKQAIRKPPVSHYSRHFRFKDGLNLVAGRDKETAYPSGALGMAKLFFTAFTWHLKGTQEDRETNASSFPSPLVTIPSPIIASQRSLKLYF